ncbi:MAG: hypothetical protein CR996_00985 [Draconibacterium sp.]|nr:MAG: hypothetical protein CR996_00985 [Draconibacterium sp.]PIF06545.1 MAG: hypothetical protein CSA36_00870 [Draconibacterium sp.]
MNKLLIALKTLKYLLFWAFLLWVFPALSQESSDLKPIIGDSTKQLLERKNEYNKLVSGNLFSETEALLPTLPKIDFTSGFINIPKVTFEALMNKSIYFAGSSPGIMNPFFSPFFNNGVILSQDAHALGNKFIIGGYSYKGNSVFAAPFPNQGLNHFDISGASLFLQYKVSKNIKIETRVNVSQSPGPQF